MCHTVSSLVFLLTTQIFFIMSYSVRFKQLVSDSIKTGYCQNTCTLIFLLISSPILSATCQASGGRGSPGRLVSQRGLWCHDMALCIFMIFLHSLERPSRRMLLQIPPPINQRRNHSGLWPKVGMTLIMLAMRPNCPCPWPTGTGRTVCRQRSSVCGQSS